MEKKIYMAPMEGVPDYIYRRTFNKYYGGVEKFFTPFLSPNDTEKFPTREWKEIDPEHNEGMNVVPQILCCKSNHFIWCASRLLELGYKEINLNLGCPSGTVVAKKKGSGLLYYPDELDAFLEDIYTWAAGQKVDMSIKTRIGRNAPEEIYEVLDIYNKYPISELTVHPRIQKDYYREPVRMEYFDYVYNHSKNPICYNGDMKNPSDCEEIEKKYPNITAIMLGRGLIGCPEFTGQGIVDRDKFKDFHRELLQQYVEVLSGEKPVISRMKEFWSFLDKSFLDEEKALKKIRKAKSVEEYRINVEDLLRNGTK